MEPDPGKSEQEGTSQATPETAPQPGMLERLRQLPNDLARSKLIDECIATAEAKLKSLGCQPIFGGL